MVEMYRTARPRFLLILSLLVMAPLFEEIFFRGFLIQGLRRSSIGAAGAVALSAFAWASLHVQYDLYGIASVALMGIGLGVARLRTG